MTDPATSSPPAPVGPMLLDARAAATTAALADGLRERQEVEA
jgi:hypothetical protein